MKRSEMRWLPLSKMLGRLTVSIITVVFLLLFKQLLVERDAMGDDEYHPIGMSGSNLTAAGGIGYTVVDSLDTMLLMGSYLRAFMHANSHSIKIRCTFGAGV